MNKQKLLSLASKVKSTAVVLGITAVGAANAAAVDVADVVTDIAAQAAPVAAIGAAVLILMVGIKAFKWVRRAM